jgi:hypothetical protein
MMEQMPDPTIQDALTAAIAQQEGYSAEEPPKEDKMRFFEWFSLGALVFGPIYYIAMRDRLLTWLSVLAVALVFPLIVILPFFARRRAWETREWQGFNQYAATQKKWDRAGWWVLAGTLVLAVLLWNMVVSPALDGFGADPYQAQKDLREILGDE